jgi:streptogramin lyase
MLGTTTGKLITAMLAVVLVTGGVAAAIAARGGLHLGTASQPTARPTHTPAPTKPPTPTPQPAGIVTEFSLPTGGSFPAEITTGPDGNLWFTECFFFLSANGCPNSKIGRITPQGQITEFPLAPQSFPDNITAGPDGKVWFTEESA